MRYIKIIGSKLFPVPKKVKRNKKLIISKIKPELKNGLIHLYIIGENINNEFYYEWDIMLDDNKISPSSIGPILILNKSNTKRYLESSKVNVTITVNNYISPTFEI